MLQIYLHWSFFVFRNVKLKTVPSIIFGTVMLARLILCNTVSEGRCHCYSTHDFGRADGPSLVASGASFVVILTFLIVEKGKRFISHFLTFIFNCYI